MRFIIPELPYEAPVAKGLWRYEQDGEATGAVEQWRLSTAHDGYQFLRVDLDARLAASGRSYLFHAVLDAESRPVRLKYRLWQGSQEVMGNVQLERDAVLFTSGQDERRVEEMIALDEGYKFWFPCSSALGLLAKSQFDGWTPAVTLVVSENGANGPALLPLVTSVNRQGPRYTTGSKEALGPITLSWENQQRTLWLDAQGWPLRMRRQDGVTARETELILYQQIS